MTTIEQTGAEEVAWDLSDLYASGDDPRIESDFAEAEAAATAFRDRYYGKVATLSRGRARRRDRRVRADRGDRDARPLLRAHELLHEHGRPRPRRARREARREGAPASRRSSSSSGSSGPRSRTSRPRQLLEDPALDHWRHWLSAQRVFRPYLLTEPEEKILTEKAVSGVSAWSRLYEEVLGGIRVDLEGEAEPVALETAMAKLYSADRDERRGAAEAVTEALQPTIRTRTSIFNTILVDKWIDDRLRGYPTWITSRNLANETSDDAVQALIDAATSRYDVPQRYYRLKAKLLGLDRLEHYDRFAPVAEDASKTSWDEARRVVVDAYGSFSSEAGAAVEQFFDDGWIDAPVRPDKRHGAYCATNVPGVHPYVFMNYTGDRRSILTLAHELGHALHGSMAQPLGLLQRVDAADDRRDGLGVRRGAHVQGAARRRGRPARAARPAHRAARGRDRDDVPPDRDEPLREPRPHRAARAGRALDRPAQRAVDRVPDGAVRRLGRGRRLRHLVELHPALHGHARATSTPTRTGTSSRSRSSARTSARATRSSAPYLDLLRAGGSKAPEELARMVGLDLTDPSIWASGIDAIADDLDEAEALAAEIGLG